jgi:hypothetical protein
MNMKYLNKKTATDSPHKHVKRLSHGGEIHSFDNCAGTPYMADYTAEGLEVLNTMIVNPWTAAIKRLEDAWEEGKRWTWGVRRMA